MGASLSRSLTRFHSIDDPTVTAELYTWSSAEFRDGYALIYTSRSNPSLTCICHYRVNPDKVLFALHDCLFEGNTVRVDMEFVGDRDYNGRFVLRCTKARESSGSFTERVDTPGMFLLSYNDKFKRRMGELKLLCFGRREEYFLRFTTGIVGDIIVTYCGHVTCCPFKGLDVHICSPRCDYDDYIRPRPIGPCNLNNVSGMPAHDLLKEKKQDNGCVWEA